ncbi:MAG: hypothetical protein SH868_16525 [Bythopirellula sp.]|nr:hypothetical protein [Bythopirellula sp.]
MSRVEDSAKVKEAAEAMGAATATLCRERPARFSSVGPVDNAGVSGAGGAILVAIVGLIKKAMAARQQEKF